MREQGELIVLMIQNEIKKNNKELHSITNHEFLNPKKIEVNADEIVFISFLRVKANTDFTLEYSSSTESRMIEKVIVNPGLIENNTVTKHHSNIKFNISNNDEYEVSVVKLKFI